MQTPVLKIVKPQTKPEKTTRSTVDTIMLTHDMPKHWPLAPFQRPIRVNDKLLGIVEDIKRDGGVLPGVLTFGVLDRTTYVVDGQHRIKAFELSEMAEGFADTRTVHFESMADMAEEFVNLNSKIVTFRPDDILRGLEQSYPALLRIRKECAFVGYDMVRRNAYAPILSMATVLRTWAAATAEVPVPGSSSATERAKSLTEDEAEKCARYLNICFKAWGRDPEYSRLWGTLNLGICGWLYRRVVLGDGFTSTKRHIRLSGDEYGKAIMGLSTGDDYMSWLVGRGLVDRDRAPAFNRIKAIIGRRINRGGEKRIMFPQPEWATS